MAESFGDPILLRVSRDNWLPSNTIIVTINIELVVLKLPSIVGSKASNSNITVLVFSLKALESGKGFAFLIENLDLRALIPVI